MLVGLKTQMSLAARSTELIPPRFLFQECLEACKGLMERFTEIGKMRSELALYLCEDANQLSLQELFGTIGTFRQLFIKSLKVREDLL